MQCTRNTLPSKLPYYAMKLTNKTAFGGNDLNSASEVLV